MNLPKFTILTAVRNCSLFVVDTLRSVLAQSYPNWEMIISDDCSIDDTVQKIEEFIIRNNVSNIILTKNINRLYCGMNYNKILQLATGKYCGVLDGDDMLLPHSIATVVKYYESNPAIDFIWTMHNWYNRDMTKHRLGLSSKPTEKNIYKSEKGLRHVYSHWRTFKTEMRDRGQLFRELRCTVDKDLGYSLEELGSGAFLPIVLYNYRYHKDNMSHHSSQKAEWVKIRRYHKNIKRNNVITFNA